jgi:HAD superfamily hydrolase (TIGR01509 family)
MNHKALIFDFDGVIGSSERSRFIVFQKAFAENGITLPETAFMQMIGHTTQDFLYDISVDELTDEKKNAIRTYYNKAYKGNVKSHIKPNIPVVRFIKNYDGTLPLAIASGSDKAILMQMVKLFGIEGKFAAIVGKEDVMKYKPHPETYLTAAEKLGVKPEECIVIEDSLVGVLAALAAGTYCYVYLNGVNSKEMFSHVPVKGFIQMETDFQKVLPTL